MSDVQNSGQNPQQGQTIIINQQPTNSNGVGTAGFVLSLVAIVLCWIPVLDWILWGLGLILSFVGVFKNPKGLAIAGLVISVIDMLILVLFIGAAIAAFS